MKIMIPVDENSSSRINTSFGRTPYFLMYDTDMDERKYVENTAANSQGGAGIKAAQIIVDNSADAIITPQLGENAAEVLNAANIKIYKSKDNSVQDNIDSLINKKLSLLNNVHKGLHGHGENV